MGFLPVTKPLGLESYQIKRSCYMANYFLFLKLQFGYLTALCSKLLIFMPPDPSTSGHRLVTGPEGVPLALLLLLSLIGSGAVLLLSPVS